MTTHTITGTTRRQLAEQRLVVIRTAFEVADAELERAFVERDWAELEFDSWEAYCAAVPGYRHFKMKAGPRRERVAMLRAKGANIPQLKAATGASVGTIHNDLALLEGGHRREPVSVLKDEASRQPVQATPPAPQSGYRAAVALVAAHGAHGLTVKELAAATGWHHGQSSGALSKAARKQLIKAVPSFRDGCAAYVAL